MNKYIEKIAELNLLERRSKNYRKNILNPIEVNKKYIDHPTNSESDDLLETEEAARIAGE